MNVAGASAFRLRQQYCASLKIDVPDFHLMDFGLSRTSEQRGLHHRPEPRLSGSEKRVDIRSHEVADSCNRHVPERLYAAPCAVVGDTPVGERAVGRGF